MDSSFNLAVHALVCLSHSGRSLSSEALAENICTNPTRVRRVLAGLKKAGMVETREGLDGGYRLCTDPAALSLRQVAEAINTRFVDCAWHSGDIDRDCAICSGMAGVMDALYRQMNEQCAAYLSHITITDIETQLLLRVKEPPLGVLASADNPVSHGASGFCRWKKQLYYAKKHSRRVHLWLCFVFSCLLLRGLDMERQHISRSYMGYLICHHSGSLPCRYVGIPTAVVSGLTLNMAFSIYLPYRFSAIYFSAM